jgi:hypothetical protein
MERELHVGGVDPVVVDAVRTSLMSAVGRAG